MIPSTSELNISFDLDLKEALLARVPREIPASLLKHAALLRPVSRRRVIGTWVARMAGAAATTVAVVAAFMLVWTVAFGARAADPATVANGHAAHSWGTQLVKLEANDLVIDVAGQAFTPPQAGLGLHSDPGTASYRTLEMYWQQNGVEMRLFWYFAADQTTWWVSSVRSYDGTSPGEWVYYVEPQITAPLGQMWVGDVDMLGLGVHGIGRLQIQSLRLTAFVAGTIPNSPGGCQIAEPTPPAGQQVDSLENPEIAGAPLVSGMTASKAENLLRTADVCYRFQLEYPASNLSQLWCSAPPGSITDWSFGNDGVVILFVEAPPAETIAPDALQVAGC